MEIPRIGNAKELNSKVIEDHKIVAVFGICNNTLCIQDHALQRYVSRGEAEKLDSTALDELYYSLSVSLVIKRKNEAKQRLKHGLEKSMYRFMDGWIFVLTWIEQLGIWLLKTAYRKDKNNARVYSIQCTRAAIRASAWEPA